MKTYPEDQIELENMYETENDISLMRRTELNRLLNQHLASSIDLLMQMKQAHWNVKGPNFIALHQLFDNLHEGIETQVDLIAERVVQLGGIAAGTVRFAAAGSRLAEYPSSISEGPSHVEAVARALSTFGHQTRTAIAEAQEFDDAVTADILTEVTRKIDQSLWFVEAHSQACK